MGKSVLTEIWRYAQALGGYGRSGSPSSVSIRSGPAAPLGSVTRSLLVRCHRPPFDRRRVPDPVPSARGERGARPAEGRASRRAGQHQSRQGSRVARCMVDGDRRAPGVRADLPEIWGSRRGVVAARLADRRRNRGDRRAQADLPARLDHLDHANRSSVRDLPSATVNGRRAVAAAAILTTVAASLPARSHRRPPRCSKQRVTIQGRGYGHGRGMSHTAPRAPRSRASRQADPRLSTTRARRSAKPPERFRVRINADTTGRFTGRRRLQLRVRDVSAAGLDVASLGLDVPMVPRPVRRPRQPS